MRNQALSRVDMTRLYVLLKQKNVVTVQQHFGFLLLLPFSPSTSISYVILRPLVRTQPPVY
jgi:hypothetical protein